MTDMNKLSESALEQVTGGKERTVRTGTGQNAAVRIDAGTENEQIYSLPDGSTVNATGRFKKADGRNWAQINRPVKGWVAASIIGYPR